MKVKHINLAKVEQHVARAVETADEDSLARLRNDLVILRRLAFGSPAASARPALYTMVGLIDQRLSALREKADTKRVEVLTARIDSQLEAARTVLAEKGQDPRARLDSVRAHLRVAWDARQELGGKQANPRLRAALDRLCRSVDGKDGRPQFFSELEKEFGKIDEQCELLISEIDRLKMVERAAARMVPKGNSSLRVGRGVVLV